VFHPGGGVLGGVVPDPVHGERDDGRGAGRDCTCGESGSEFGAFCRLGVAADPGPGQDRGREADPAVRFGDADAEPGTEELGSVPASVISRRGRDGRSWRSGLDIRGNEAGVVSCGGIGTAMRPRSAGFGEGFDAVVPARDPGPAVPGPGGGYCVCDGPGPGAVHGTSTEDLQVLDGP
jgi:hypothetical protein